MKLLSQIFIAHIFSSDRLQKELYHPLSSMWNELQFVWIPDRGAREGYRLKMSGRLFDFLEVL